jgi:AraC family transcriptional regulator
MGLPRPPGRVSDGGSPPLDTILFASRLATVGAFRAPPEHPHFHDSGPIQNWVFVFPRTAVWIRHPGGQAFVADPNVITFYNRGQTYRRDRISPAGDRCEWFAVAQEAVVEAVRRFRPEVEARPDRPFPLSHSRADARLYLLQRALVGELEASPVPDVLRTEEACLELLHRSLAHAFGRPKDPPRVASATERRHLDLAMAAAAILAHGFREDVSLDGLASRLGVSAGHLCRCFRRHVGRRLHEHRDQLRLRASLEEIADGRDLTDVALDLGYSSHSHFTAAFRRAFGIVPSDARRRLARGVAWPFARPAKGSRPVSRRRSGIW